MTEERRLLLSKSYGMVILDEAHRARGGKVLGQDERKANNLLTFMVEIARRTRHLLLGTATPIQTDVADLWDLMNILAPRRRLRPRRLDESLARPVERPSR